MQKRTILGVVVLLAALAGLAVGAAAPAELTAEQKALLRKRDRLGKRMMEQWKVGELAEATDLCGKVLRLQRQVFSDRNIGVMQILGMLAQLEEARGRWVEAEEARREAAAVVEGLFGKEHWKAIDARQELANVRLRARLKPKQRAMLTRAYRLHAEAGKLSGPGQAEQAIPLLQQALRLHKEVQGEKHPDYVVTLNNLAMLFRDTGKHGKALPLLLQVLSLRREVQGEKHPKYANSLNNLAALYLEMGENSKALPLFQQALSLRREALGEKHPDYAISLNNLAALYLERGEYGKAMILLQQALRLVKEVEGEKHPLYATTLNNLASLYQGRGEYGKALPLMQQVLRLVKEVEGEKHPLYARSLDNLALLYQAMGEYSKALPLYQQSLRLRRKVQGEKHPDQASSLDNLAMLYQDMGEHGKALPLSRQAVSVRREALGEKHPLYAISLSHLASLYTNLGEHGKALPLAQQALRLYREALGEKHPHYVNGLNNLAAIFQDMGEYSKALPLARQALRLVKEVQGEKPLYATTLNNLASLYQAMGEYSKALPLARQAQGLYREVLGEKHPHYCRSLNDLAKLYQDMGEHGKALPLFQQALRLYREVLGEKHPRYAGCLLALASLYQRMGEHGKALPLAQQALRLYREALGEKHPDYATTLNNLASLHQSRREYGKAVALYQQALRLHKEVQGEKHPNYARSLNNLAVIYWTMRDYGKALPLFQQALRLRREVLGEKHPDYANSLNNLASLYQRMGEHGKALPLFQQALSLRREALGEKHPDYAANLHDLALLYQERGRASAAVVLSGQALAVKLAHAQDTLGAVDDRQRLVLLEQLSVSLSWFLTATAGSDLPAEELYRWVLGVKGVLASASRSRLDLLASDKPELKRLLQELQSARASLARLTRTTPAPGEMASWRERFDRLETSKRRAQEELARASPEFARWQRRPSAAEIASALPADSALIEFLSYTHALSPDRNRRDWYWDPQLVAFVVRPGRPIELVYLGSAGAFEAAVRAWRRPLLSRRPSQPDPLVSEWLRKHLWKPVEKHLAGVKTVLIAPDGELANLPFAALPGKEPGSFLLEQYAFGSVPSGRQLLNAPSNKPASGLLAVGGVSFGAPPAKGDRPTRLWAALPGTSLEAEQVERLFRARFAAASTRRLSGTEADRASVLSALTPASKRWRYLHLATHGYFEPARTRFSAALPAAGLVGVASAPGLVGPLSALANVLAVDDPDIFDPRQGFDPSGRSARVHGRNPMLAAGLVLSGANRLDGDGVLTAEEISGLDLRGCSVAVLSACQTALGKQEGYQGVQGLQRAFHDAGCAHLVASLWNVNDVATSVLVEEFYQQLWRHKMSPLQALRLAQLAVLKDPERVRRRAKKLKPLLAKLGVKREELASRGFEDDAVVGKPPERPKGELSPVAWWAAWTVSGRPGR